MSRWTKNLPSLSLSFLISYGDNSYLVDHSKRTAVKGFCNLQVVFSCWDFAWDTSYSPSAALCINSSSAKISGHYYPTTVTLACSGPSWWQITWTAEAQLHGKDQLP
ncbi:Hypothetical predicted protein [Marmota monax]|uniref:Uncharacterized protein n=1 Tax=Marmota monax TaxID=9995 RepID=A0A5E4AVI6_MARMO|nr:hypothetical protein GHT09_001332 [Marmota monax]VTJ61467.1 Hypothetical predicted protein [Marmota monax]